MKKLSKSAFVMIICLMSFGFAATIQGMPNQSLAEMAINRIQKDINEPEEKKNDDAFALFNKQIEQIENDDDFFRAIILAKSGVINVKTINMLMERSGDYASVFKLYELVKDAGIANYKTVAIFIETAGEYMHIESAQNAYEYATSNEGRKIRLNHVDVYNSFMNALIQTYDYEKALKVYQTAVHNNKVDEQTVCLMLIAKGRQDRFVEVKDDFIHEMRKPSCGVKIYDTFIMLAGEAGQTDYAREACRYALSKGLATKNTCLEFHIALVLNGGFEEEFGVANTRELPEYLKLKATERWHQNEMRKKKENELRVRSSLV